MASEKQLRYVRDLLRSKGASPKDYVLDALIPGSLVGNLIDSLLKGEVPEAKKWNEEVSRFLENNEEEDYQAFTSELTFIRDYRLREVVESILRKAPVSFYQLPASSTGRYHPNYALGKGGLLRHTKAAVKIALELFNNPGLTDFDQKERDLIIGALILHDICKEDYVTHPLAVEGLLDIELREKYPELEDSISKMFCCIRSHMGPWTKDKLTGKELWPKPETELEKFVHLADYLASRKFLEVVF